MSRLPLLFSTFGAFAMCAFTAGCAAPTAQGYSSTIQTWKGISLSQLKQGWGEPNKSLDNRDGTVTYYYYNSKSYGVPASYISTGYIDNFGNITVRTTGSESYGYSEVCNTFFTVDENTLIVKADFSGTMCKAKPPSSSFLKAQAKAVDAAYSFVPPPPSSAVVSSGGAECLLTKTAKFGIDRANFEKWLNGRVDAEIEGAEKRCQSNDYSRAILLYIKFKDYEEAKYPYR